MFKIKKAALIVLAIATAPSSYAFADDSTDQDTRRAAFEACVTETGVTKPAQGERPSDEDRQKMDACLQAKGISFGGGHHGGPRGPGDGDRRGHPPGRPKTQE